ncbi:MAG: hypothetical protein IJE71_02945 [Clostridia bacterium]|nr:hypothetical protein [Clostridia bacterium]
MDIPIRPILQPMQEFGPCLRAILAERDISASELSRVMAYKSRNSVFRILDGEGGHAARQAFLERLIDEDPLLLSPEERERLEQALEISRVGQTGFVNNRALMELMLDAEMEEHDPPVRIISVNGNTLQPESVAAYLKTVEELEVTIIGCCDREIFSKLGELIRFCKGKTKLGIRHYIYTDERTMIRSISAIHPVLYFSCYEAFAVEPGVFSQEKEAMYRANSIFLHAREKSGEWYDQMLLLVDRRIFCRMNRRPSGAYLAFKMLLEKDSEKMRPFKTQLSAEGQVSDYLQYVKDCLHLEQGRSIYMIKLDIPISFVHPDVLVSCALDGFAAESMGSGEELGALVEQMAVVQLQRWENYFGKHKPTHVILSRREMERFAKTGRQTDHFFILRPYTPSERGAILRNIRAHAQSNPYFHVCFFKGAFDTPPVSEIALYEGAGMLLTKPYTHYNLAQDHAEALIPDATFCRQYKEFFMQDLLANHVLTQEETLAELDRLIQLAEQSE